MPENEALPVLRVESFLKQFDFWDIIISKGCKIEI